jgi:hypothetical protein
VHITNTKVRYGFLAAPFRPPLLLLLLPSLSPRAVHLSVAGARKLPVIHVVLVPLSFVLAVVLLVHLMLWFLFVLDGWQRRVRARALHATLPRPPRGGP